MSETTVFCRWERARFPESDFVLDEQHRWVHRGEEPPHTKDGDRIKGEGPPPPADRLLESTEP